MQTLGDNVGKEDSADSIIREFILAAPPGDLHTVLAALRVLTGDDALFFAIAPKHCLAHHMRCIRVFTFDAEADGKDSSGMVSFLTGRHNHLVTFIQQYAKAHGVPLREVMESVEDYFHRHCGTAVMASYCVSPRGTSGDEAKRMNNDGNGLDEVPLSDTLPEDVFASLDCVFFDLALRLYIEIDPMTERCLRVVHFASVAPLPAALAAVECQSPNGHDGPLRHTRAAAQRLMAQYAAACFTAAPQTSVCTSPLSSSAAGAVGTGAVLWPVPTGYVLVLCVSAVWRLPRSMWAARRASLFTVAPGEKSVCVRGETHVHAHHYEDGNAHVELRRVMEPVALPEWPAEMFGFVDNATVAVHVPQLCESLMKAIHTHERTVHDAVLRAARDTGEKALQQLRRRLPIARQLFDCKRGKAIMRTVDTGADESGEESVKEGSACA